MYASQQARIWASLLSLRSFTCKTVGGAFWHSIWRRFHGLPSSPCPSPLRVSDGDVVVKIDSFSSFFYLLLVYQVDLNVTFEFIAHIIFRRLNVLLSLFGSYAIIVMVEGQEERVKTWTEMQAMNRLCGSVAKVNCQLGS